MSQSRGSFRIRLEVATTVHPRPASCRANSSQTHSFSDEEERKLPTTSVPAAFIAVSPNLLFQPLGRVDAAADQLRGQPHPEFVHTSQLAHSLQEYLQIPHILLPA